MSTSLSFSACSIHLHVRQLMSSLWPPSWLANLASTVRVLLCQSFYWFLFLLIGSFRSQVIMYTSHARSDMASQILDKASKFRSAHCTHFQILNPKMCRPSRIQPEPVSLLGLLATVFQSLTFFAYNQVLLEEPNTFIFFYIFNNPHYFLVNLYFKLFPKFR